jgi:hypothetical protein
MHLVLLSDSSKICKIISIILTMRCVPLVAMQRFANSAHAKLVRLSRCIGVASSGFHTEVLKSILRRGQRDRGAIGGRRAFPLICCYFRHVALLPTFSNLQ